MPATTAQGASLSSEPKTAGGSQVAKGAAANMAPPETTSAADRDAMKKYWSEHSSEATLEEMMLDSQAKELSAKEMPQILSMVDVAGKRVLELGAGIGRFTAQLAAEASHVTAVDFMESFVAENRATNGARFGDKVDFVCADVAECGAALAAERSLDMVFSNWLLMYLADAEAEALVQHILGWLVPGGVVFIRESCFHKCGDAARGHHNPSHYRSPQSYAALFERASLVSATATTYGFELVRSQNVTAYEELKGNPNQLAWVFRKVARSVDGLSFQQFLDNQQYTANGILRYERVFGAGFVSTGGQTTTEEFTAYLGLGPGQRVLDVGAGIGGGDFLMADRFGASVLGIDLSTNMIKIARERAAARTDDLVQFEVLDCTTCCFAPASFDVVYSRDTLLHVEDKLSLFRRFHQWLKPGGRLLISDYCCGEGVRSPEFQAYRAQRGYHLHSPAAYGDLLRQAGFADVRAEDRTQQFLEMLERELAATESNSAAFIADFSESDYNAIVGGWKAKVKRVNDGDQKWGLFQATKLPAALSS